LASNLVSFLDDDGGGLDLRQQLLVLPVQRRRILGCGGLFLILVLDGGFVDGGVPADKLA